MSEAHICPTCHFIPCFSEAILSYVCLSRPSETFDVSVNMHLGGVSLFLSVLRSGRFLHHDWYRPKLNKD